MKRLNIDRDWYFEQGRPSPTTFMRVEEQRLVSLPHDFMLESETSADAPDGAASGYYKGGIGTYTKLIDLPAELAGQRVCIESDGAYMNTEISVNGNFVAAHHYGYTPFCADITEYAKPGERNRLMLTVNNGNPYTGRWYTGSGLYRHVYMLAAPKIHLSPWPIYAYTERVDGGNTAHIVVEVAAENHTDRAYTGRVRITLSDAAGDGGGNGNSGGTACGGANGASGADSSGANAHSGYSGSGGASACGGTGVASNTGGSGDSGGNGVVSGSGSNGIASGAGGTGGSASGANAHSGSGINSACSIASSSGGRVAAERTVAIYLPPMSKRAARCRLAIESARIWDIDSPELYTIRAELAGLDEDEALFGIRTVSADARNGFMLNGRTVKIKGGCVHHTNGILGAMSFYGSEHRKAKLHKDAGFNAIRCAHNPPSRDMLEACDRLGVMVLDEAFDMWRMSGNLNDYHSYFESCWKADVEAFMLRDRTHPCVVMWSTGNEIQERNGLSRGYGLAWEIAEHMRGLDRTRPITNAICEPFNGLEDKDMRRLFEDGAARYAQIGQSMWGDATEPFAAPLDVVGYNYLDARYEPDAKAYPGRVMLGTESFPKDFAAVWDRVERLPHVIGDFTWTSYDYLGEAGLGQSRYCAPAAPAAPAGAGNTAADEAPAAPAAMESKYPWRAANCGDFDLCGHGRPQLHFRKIVWGSRETYIAVLPPEHYGKAEELSRWGFRGAHPFWDYPAFRGKPVKIDVYSGAPHVELLLNGKSLGRRAAGKAAGYAAAFEACYEDGELTAVSYGAGGGEISRHTLATPGKFDRLAVEIGEPVGGLAYADIAAVDACGRLVPFDDKRIRAAAKEGWELLALGSGRPATCESYTGGVATTYLGRAQAILRAVGGDAGAPGVAVELA
ncbi:MAG: DUF4982 domain-containing protein [Clostridiales bacterium]|nr:DUF4982 domain-containing protein [Clostridiales bacterium]